MIKSKKGAQKSGEFVNISRALQCSIGVGLALSPLSTLAVPTPEWPGGAQKHEKMISTLNNAIDITSIASQLILISSGTPIMAVGGVLIAVSTFMTKLRDTLSNQNDLATVAKQCAEICFAIYRGTLGQSEEDLSPSTIRAISELKEAVKRIQATISQREKNSSVVVGAFRSQADAGLISGWKAELNRIMKIFNTEMHIATSMVVNETNEDIKKIKELLKTKAAILNEDVTGKRPPSRPAVLFGREGLVENVVDYIISSKPVALFGAGGIGKTSIALTALHSQSIIDVFQDQRRFVRCDSLEGAVSIDTFLDLVGDTVGAVLNKNDRLGSLQAFLESRKILIVLDNAETILDSPTDSTQISEAIREIVLCESVSLILTTRTTRIPYNIPWNRIQVPVLSESAAMDTFLAIYPLEDHLITQIEELLSILDYHPLSVHLLAQAGAQNSWPPDELMENWNKQQTRLLHLDRPGVGKLESLEVTIELSLNSPAITRIPQIRDVLQIIAFLPRGLHKPKVMDLFQQISNINTILTILGNSSLTSPVIDDFITMLAPIRLHIRSSSPHTMPLLKDVQAWYYAELKKHAALEPGQKGFQDGKWIVQEDTNIERLVVFYLSIPDELREATRACVLFLVLLYWHKPRKTILLPLVLKFPDGPEAPWKAGCIQQFGMIARSLGDYDGAKEMFNTARPLCITKQNSRSSIECLEQLGLIEKDLMNIPAARDLFEQAIRECEESGDDDFANNCKISLAQVTFLLGDRDEARVIFGQVLEYYEDKKDLRSIAAVKSTIGNMEFAIDNLQEARKHLLGGIDTFRELEDYDAHAACLRCLSRVESRSGHQKKAQELLEEARNYFLKDNKAHQAAQCLKDIAINYKLQLGFARAEELLKQGREEFRQLGARKEEVDCIEEIAGIHFAQNNYLEAITLYVEAQKAYEAMGNTYGQAQCLVSVGDIASKLKEFDQAKECFISARAKFEKLKLPGRVFTCTHHLGTLAYSQGDSVEGFKLMVEARDGMLSKGLISDAGILVLMWGYAVSNIYLEQGRTILEEAIPLLEESKNMDGMAGCKQQLGLLFSLEDQDKARLLINEGKSIFDSLGLYGRSAMCLKNLAFVEVNAKNFGEAGKRYKEAEETFRRIGYEKEAQNCEAAAKKMIAESLSENENSGEFLN